jgi:hypothetical protein
VRGSSGRRDAKTAPTSEGSPVDVTVELRGAALFKLIWDAVVDVLGTAATAAL